MFYFYDKPGWFFAWSHPRWRLEQGYEDIYRFAIYESKGEKQIFELHRHSTKYGEGWTPIDVTGFWVAERDTMHTGAPIGAFLRELVTAQALSQKHLDKYIPHKTYDSLKKQYCSCTIALPRVGCLVHTVQCKCDNQQIFNFGCRCGGI